MRRGEIWLVDRRPAVVVSNDAANSTAEQLGRGVITVVPVTSNLRRVYPFQTLLPAEETGLRTDSKALAEQVRSVDAQRLSSHIATIPPRLMADLDDALRIHLAL